MAHMGKQAQGGDSTTQGLTVHGRRGHAGPGPTASRVGIHCSPAGPFGVQLTLV